MGAKICISRLNIHPWTNISLNWNSPKHVIVLVYLKLCWESLVLFNFTSESGVSVHILCSPVRFMMPGMELLPGTAIKIFSKSKNNFITSVSHANFNKFWLWTPFWRCEFLDTTGCRHTTRPEKYSCVYWYLVKSFFVQSTLLYIFFSLTQSHV